MGTKKKISNGTPNGAVLRVDRDVNILPKKKAAQKAKPEVNESGILEPAQIHQLMGIIDNRELLHVLTEVRNGNFSVRMPIDQVGLGGKICDTSKLTLQCMIADLQRHFL